MVEIFTELSTCHTENSLLFYSFVGFVFPAFVLIICLIDVCAMYSALAPERSCQACMLFGLRQKDSDVQAFTLEFLAAADEARFNEAELKVIFNSCLNEPLDSGEMRLLRSFGYGDMV